MPKVGETKAAVVWESKTITLLKGKSFDSLKPTKTKVVVHGALAVHPCIMDRKLWSLSHVPTGLRMISVKTEADAKRVGEFLWRKACLALREKDKDAVKAKLPAWVEPWLKRINNVTEAWIDPPADT